MAKYKSELFKGDLLVDLSGGLGVDDFYFCKSFNKVVSYDTDSYLNDIVKYNFQQLNINNHQRITQNADLVSFQEVPESATIYIDPDRRNEDGKRQFLPENHQPNIYEILKKVKPKTRVLVKLSPMVDIELLKKNIKNLNRIWVISHKYENKEILLECNTDHKKEIISVDLNNTTQIIKSKTETKAPEINWEKPFLYIPSPSVIKADLCKELAHKFKLTSVNKSNRILFSNSNQVELPARKFKVLQRISYKPKTLNKTLKQLNILKADLLARDFFDNTAKLRKRHKISSGGEHFIVFTNNYHNEPLVFICEKA